MLAIGFARHASGHVTDCDFVEHEPPLLIPYPTKGAPKSDAGVFCSELAPGSLGGLYGVPPAIGQPLATNYFGRGFNSVYDVTLANDSSMWFLDSGTVAFGGSSKIKPILPSGVYRRSFSGNVRMMAVDLVSPLGLAFGPEEKTLYVSDVVHLNTAENQE